MYYSIDPISILKLESFNSQLQLESNSIKLGHESIQLSYNGSLIVGISGTSIHLWNCQPFLLLATLKHTDLSEFGYFVNVFWRPMALEFFVVTFGVSYTIEEFSEKIESGISFCTENNILAFISQSNTLNFSLLSDSGFSKVKSIKLPPNKLSCKVSLKWCNYGKYLMVLRGHLIMLYSPLGFLISTFSAVNFIDNINQRVINVFSVLDSFTMYIFYSYKQENDKPSSKESLRGLCVPLIYSQNYKSSLLPSSETKLTFLSSSKLMLYSTNINTELKNYQPDFVSDSLEIPNDYLTKFGTPKLCTLSSTHPLIVLMFSNGLICYNTDKNTWKELSFEKIRVLGSPKGFALTYDRYILFSSQMPNASGQHQVLAVDSTRPALSEAIIFSLTFESEIAHMELFQSFLTVFMANNRVQVFKLLKSQESLQPRLLFSTSLEPIFPNSIKPNKIVCSYVSRDQSSFLFVSQIGFSTSTIFCKYTYAGSPQINSRRMTGKLSFSVKTIFSLSEWFTISPGNYQSMEFGIFSFDGENLSYKLIDLESLTNDQEMSPKLIEQQFSIGLKCYPLKISSKNSTVSGIEHFVNLLQSSESRNSSLIIQCFYVHFYLDYTVSTHRDHKSHRKIVERVKPLSRMSIFPTFFELLLLSVLEDTTLKNDYLRKILKILEEFDCYYSVITHCARKTEMNTWKDLFSEIEGGLCGVFLECVGLGKLEIASNLLVILYALEEPRICELLTYALLNQAVKAGNNKVVSDIMRLVTSTSYSMETSEGKMFDSFIKLLEK
ncbi:hypothetical protein BB560_001245 [Smittium megazygosporum]|uniref:RIC1 C-terminal alpha solenoid region domain-containing protein n=1 Tax=Smittium megazygosporum TaxID=133381 RepID=A0A2T9ZI46_9FUNG|nr:hypothetical protein BB560_001245 [Smittium megazygosporum]